MAAILKKTSAEIKELNAQQRKVENYRSLQSAIGKTTAALKKYRDEYKFLKDQSKTGNLSEEQVKQMKSLEQAIRRTNATFKQQATELSSVTRDLNVAGMNLNRLAEDEIRLKQRTHQATMELNQQQQALQRLNRAQQQYHRYSNFARNGAAAGMTAGIGGVGLLYSLRQPINESKRVDVESNRIAALGLGENVTRKAVKYAEAMDTFGTSILDNMTLLRDGLTIFSDLHHAEMVAPTLAKMKFSNQAMFGHEKGEENERAFMDMLKVIELRGGLKSEKAFQDQANKIQQVITATGGRVQGSEWLNAIKTGGIAVKGLTDEALYYKMESIVQEWGGNRFGTAAMSAYQNIYQGRTTKRAANNMLKLGLIDDQSKLKHDKTGQNSYLDVGAIKGAEIFKKDQFAWMEQILLPTLAKNGITEKSDVLDTIGSIFTNRTASNLFSDMYLQRDIINKSAKMNAGADNIDQLYGKATNTTAGKEYEAKAKLHDAYLKFGRTILPIYTRAIEIATNATQAFTAWMDKNPAAAKALGTGLIIVATSLVTIGGALVVLSPLLLGMASLRLVMTSLAMGGTVLTSVFSKLPAVFGLLKMAFMGVGQAFLFIGRLMLANPIGLAITAIAVGVYLIYKNWEPIKGFFEGIWGSVKTAFNGGITGVSALIINWSPIGLFYAAFAKVLSWFGVDLPSQFTGFGAMILTGLKNGILSKVGEVKAALSGAVSDVIDKAKNILGIHSPSRVFMGIGDYTMQGMALGITQNHNLPVKATQQATQNVISTGTTAKVTPVTPIRAQGGSNFISNDTIQITIKAEHGQPVRETARALRAEMQRIQQEERDARRRFLTDTE
ncbi:phage tail tape measure protein [Acinetobacter nosocomialis]|uniref:phage tail tape measure protein n=1 Tax=Acinetobacter nosocomialis TaxID=106654 RepID=UPI00129874C3|nr:phage tail tape measure protein [Acinetobacter nosocomialis]MRA09704.1 phage tail tape measure protein [Acinetobacter nosocomialis]